MALRVAKVLRVLCCIPICGMLYWIPTRCFEETSEITLEPLRTERDSLGGNLFTYHSRKTNSANTEEEEEEKQEEEEEGQEGKEQEKEKEEAYNEVPQPRCPPGNQYTDVACNINDDSTLKCVKDEGDVYLPFSFVRNYFEVFGELTSKNNGVRFDERFDFHHADSWPHLPQLGYKPSGRFLYFENYTPEMRENSKCITASEGVPISIQWGDEGYYYVIQIAQFGLSHYTKQLISTSGDGRKLLEDGGQGGTKTKAAWSTHDSKSRFKSNKQGKEWVMEFTTAESLLSPGITLATKDRKSCVSLDIKSHSGITVVVETNYNNKKTRLQVNYVWSTEHVRYDGDNNIYYGLGERHTAWHHLSRDLNVDVWTALKIKVNRKNSLSSILEVKLHGHGYLDNLTVSNSVHMGQFYQAANWLLRNQDSKGGWPIAARRIVVRDKLEIAPGWYSAMGQGQAMSTLVRAYIDSKQEKYLTAAVNALNPFDIDSKNGGVRAKFMGVMDWYEEYPTTPSLFVLNGFMYSLFGLYDLKETATGAGQQAAARLYNSGMTSLKAMIGMYDSGAGTLYDLRHVTAGLAPNRARWDYHTVHVSQVLQLVTLDGDPIFNTTAARWIGYLKGLRSRINT